VASLSKSSKKKKSEPKKSVVQQTEKLSDLQQLIGNDKDTYEALSSVMFLNPKNIEPSMKQAIDSAKEAEAKGDKPKAGMFYQVAGGLAIYEGNVKKVVEYYSMAEKMTGRHFAILKSPEKAVAVAQEYYKKFLPD
jgi:ABC-type glycerol-3-phosphate transport system substrate-binding protein